MNNWTTCILEVGCNLNIFERINILINYLSIKTFQEVFKMFLFVTAKIVVSKKKI